MIDSNARSTLYAGLIRGLAEPIDPESFYCSGCGNQHHECICDEPTYAEVRDHPSRYRQGAAK